jgi:hypothetical protein
VIDGSKGASGDLLLVSITFHPRLDGLSLLLPLLLIATRAHQNLVSPDFFSKSPFFGKTWCRTDPAEVFSPCTLVLS